ncbi:MAG: DUF4276 family protein [Gammaproteobacteria bacterium]|nr:DUF4276 family protein [Gammaproteobacteria bacterium]CAJ2376082.1 MAG: conserved hypothetical protein [Arenicellales bacterium IbO2]MDA7960953.1 DUF4276 family protein [Gammaproteobacteria bacterium]MDA7970236.1 DUF4276 family protein [Gammaproteobacteria bacterium]MDA7971525.1 DUF4276 family protein [Gammaproteobacteria bacterium]
MHLILLVEDLSMESFLRKMLRNDPGRSYEIRTFHGKQNLLRKLESRLRGYAHWLPADHRLIVLVDCDADDCRKLIQKAEKVAGDANLRTYTDSKNAGNKGGAWQFSVRIAIEELEAWYFGDWQAVCTAYPRAPKNLPRKAPYRKPDEIKNTWEAFERVLKKRGYFSTGLRKVEAAKKIGAHVDPDRNRSPSFKKFYKIISE